MNPEKDQFAEHTCSACPDTSEFDNLINQGGMFKNWAKAAKEHAVGSHKFDLAAKNYMENR